MQELTGSLLKSPSAFDRICEENSLAKVAEFVYSGGDSDEQLYDEAKVSKQSRSMVGELIRSKVLSKREGAV